MTNPITPAAGALFSLIAWAALGAPTIGHAAVTRWNVQSVRPSYPSQTISGYFDYDTVAGTVTGWSLNVNGIAPNNTDFVPPPNALLVPCGSPNCYSEVMPPAAGSAVGVQLGFWDVVSSTLLYYVGLTLPAGADLTGATTQVINLVGGSPYSIVVATDWSTGGATGHTGFFVGNNPNDPPATISFTNPVTGHAPEDDGSEGD